MSSHDKYFPCGAAAITENILKHRWSATLLRHISTGLEDPVDIISIEKEIPPFLLNKRLRTLLRYGLIARFPRPSQRVATVYRITCRGEKLLGILALIEELDRQIMQETEKRYLHPRIIQLPSQAHIQPPPDTISKI